MVLEREVRQKVTPGKPGEPLPLGVASEAPNYEEQLEELRRQGAEVDSPETTGRGRPLPLGLRRRARRQRRERRGHRRPRRPDQQRRHRHHPRRQPPAPRRTPRPTAGTRRRIRSTRETWRVSSRLRAGAKRIDLVGGGEANRSCGRAPQGAPARSIQTSRPLAAQKRLARAPARPIGCNPTGAGIKYRRAVPPRPMVARGPQ